MVLKRGYVTLLYTVRYGSHTVHRSNYAVLAVRCKFQDSVFLRLTVRCDTVRYGNLLQYYNTVYTTGYTGHIEIDILNYAELRANAQHVLTFTRDARPRGTSLAYNPKQKEFRVRKSCS